MEYVEGLAITVDNVENRAHHLDQLAARVARRALANLRQHLDQLGDHRFADQRNNLVLAVEINVNRPGGEARLECKFFDRSLMKRFARQHAAGRQKNLAPPHLDELVVRRLYANSFSTPWHRPTYIE